MLTSTTWVDEWYVTNSSYPGGGCNVCWLLWCFGDLAIIVNYVCAPPSGFEGDELCIMR